MSDSVIKVCGLYKKFCRNLKRGMIYSAYDVGRSMLGMSYDTSTLRRDEFWALQDVSFELKKGDTLGIIGINGSGKSTLLRLLTGIFPPDRGEIAVRGNIGALIAVGAGFHPHMTGRENIYLNGTILGMNRQQIDERFEEIIDFADIGDFIDAPVATYSSGMKVRLGFSVAVHVKPDILLVDEILSVGDLSFRNKSLRKMQEYREQANALIFISHNLEQVRVLCSRLIILNKGKVTYDGNTHEGIALYEELSREKRTKSVFSENTTNPESSAVSTLGDSTTGEIQILEIGLQSQDNRTMSSVRLNDSLIISCKFTVHKDMADLYFSAAIIDEQWTSNVIRLMSNDNQKALFEDIEAGSYTLKVVIDNHHLAPGVYYAQIAVRNGKTGETYERATSVKPFDVLSDGVALERGFINVDEEWVLKKEQAPKAEMHS